MFDHSMFLHLDSIHPHVTVEQVLAALEPILKARGVDREYVQVQRGPIPSGPVDSDEMFVVLNESGQPKEVYVTTYGDAGESYFGAIEQAAKNFTPISAPDVIELFNHNISDPEKALTRYWIGQGEQLKVAQRANALKRSLAILHAAGLTTTQLDAVSFLVSNLPYDVSEEGNAPARPKD